MSEPAAPKPRRFVLVVVVAAVALAVDFATKQIVLNLFAPGQTVEVVGNLLRFTLVFNPGAAFSIGTGLTWVFALISVAVIIYILRMARRLRSVGWAIALGLILGGASGNLVDRIFRQPAPLHGEVIDWIQVPYWPVFNLADSCIVVGGILAVVLAFRGVNIDGTVEKGRGPDSVTETSTGTPLDTGGAGGTGTPSGPDGPDGSDGKEGDAR